MLYDCRYSALIGTRGNIGKGRTMTTSTERLRFYGAVNLLEWHEFEPPSRYGGNVRAWLIDAVKSGTLVCHDHTGLKIEPEYCPDSLGVLDETTSIEHLNSWLASIGHLRRVPCEDAQTPEPASAPAVAAAAPTPAPSASAPTVAAPEPAQKQKKPRRSWWDEVIGYLADVLRAGKHRTAKALYRAAEKLAGADGSPFEMVDRELRAREFGRVVAVKTLQNRWAEVKAAAGMG